ncbi:MAG: transporter [Phycisphaerales bacterium]
MPLTISTDRPSFSDGTGIQPLWHLNIESGYTYTHRDRDDVKTNRHNGPEVLARVGLIEDRLEFRVIWSGYIDAETDSGSSSSTANGLSDVTLGLKVKLFDQGELADWVPRLAIGANNHRSRRQ